MHINIVTLFPEWIARLRDYGVVGRGLRTGKLALRLWNPRDYSDNRNRRVDDRPYGGGPGMVMAGPPLARTLAAISEGTTQPVMLLSPQGARFNQAWAEQLAAGSGFTLVCGRYEGVDQRFIDRHVDAKLSVGDVVVSGGELPAMLIIDAVARLCAGVLGDARSAHEDSFAAGLLDHPHYTRPKRTLGAEAPAVLLSGDHTEIARWREKQALGTTWLYRADLLARLDLSERQQMLLTEFVTEYDAAVSRGDEPA
jgi:tRNA (guanine37-N1)-methyltransferase